MNARKYWLNIWSHKEGRTNLWQTEQGQSFALVDQDLDRNKLLKRRVPVTAPMMAFLDTQCCNDITALSFMGKNNFLLLDNIALNETATYWSKVLFWGAVPQQNLYIAPLCPLRQRYFCSSSLSSVHQTLGGLSVTTLLPFVLPTQSCFSKDPPCFTRALKYSALGPILFFPCVSLSASSHITSVLVAHMKISPLPFWTITYICSMLL